MDNNEKLRDAFVNGLGVDASQVNESLAYQSISLWDSTGHIALVAEIESAFDVMLDTDDILTMSSVQKAREILTKHGVTF